MYRILCYGDSNTWGYRPIKSNRYEEGVRWTKYCSKTYLVIIIKL